MFENPRRSRQARNSTTNVPKILDLKSSSEQIFSENCRWVPLMKIVVYTHATVNVVPAFVNWCFSCHLCSKANVADPCKF